MHAIKRILKAVFPVPLLKKGFLAYNALKIRTIDRLLFREQSIAEYDYIIHRNPQPFSEVKLQDLDRSIMVHMNKWKDWKQEEYILLFKLSCVIEPIYGWAFAGLNRLVYQSLSFSRTTHQHKPSLLKYWFRDEVVKLHEAISLRDTGEENYFHFYNDVLAKLFWLLENGIDVRSIPIIISEKLWSKQYFQGYLKASVFLSELKWIIQGHQFIACDNTYFVKAPTHSLSLWDAIFKAMPSLYTAKPVRVFISRSKSRLRFIKNDAQIVSISKRYGFLIVDNDALAFEDQVKLYGQASIIVGIHGSGLTNMYFRNGDCRILEIFPSPDQDYLPFHYIMLAKMKGFKYDAVLGEDEADDFSGGFSLSPYVYEEAIKRVLL